MQIVFFLLQRLDSSLGLGDDILPLELIALGFVQISNYDEPIELEQFSK
jgi:hypothetical protein